MTANRPGRSLIVLIATTPQDSYYGEFFTDIVNFHASYARAIISAGDNVLILVPSRARSFYDNLSLPADILVTYTIGDIWARDLSPVGLYKQTPFTYKPQFLSATDATYFQNQLFAFVKSKTNIDLKTRQSQIVLDGGNVVDNFRDKAIITSRVVKDNSRMSENEIAIIDEQGDTTGHSDGMVSFIDDNVIAVHTDGMTVDQVNTLTNKLRSTFGQEVRIVNLSSRYVPEMWRDFDSACGLHINALLTENNLYVPVFGLDSDNVGQSTQLDNEVLAQIRANTRKNVVPVNVTNKICRMGGSVRCLSWSLHGDMADKIVQNANN